MGTMAVFQKRNDGNLDFGEWSEESSHRRISEISTQKNKWDLVMFAYSVIHSFNAFNNICWTVIKWTREAGNYRVV